MNRQSVTPSTSISSGAAGISLLFSATIRCASTIWSACRKADIIWAALRSRNASKLPRNVLPSTAIAVKPSVAGGFAIVEAWRRKAFVQPLRHLLQVIFIQAQRLCDLSVRQIQPREIQA